MKDDPLFFCVVNLFDSCRHFLAAATVNNVNLLSTQPDTDESIQWGMAGDVPVSPLTRILP